MHGHLIFSLFCMFLIEKSAANGDSAPAYPPIRRILQNYERHLLKLKNKFDSYETKKRRPREGSVELANDVEDPAAKLVASFDENRHSTTTPANSVDFPGHQRIGILAAPSPRPPAIPPGGEKWKFWSQYARKAAAQHSESSTEGMTTIEWEDENSDEEEDVKPLDVSSITSRQTSELNETVDRSNSSVETNQIEANSSDLFEGLKLFSVFAASSPPEETAEKNETQKENKLTASIERPAARTLPIRRIEEVKSVDSKSKESSSGEEEPFQPTPDLFGMNTTETPVNTTTAVSQPEHTTTNEIVTTAQPTTSTLPSFFPWQQSAIEVSSTEVTARPPTPAHVSTFTSNSKRRPPMARGVLSFPSNRGSESRPLEAVDLDRELEFASRSVGHQRRAYGWNPRESGAVDYDDESETPGNDGEEMMGVDDEQDFGRWTRARKYVPYRLGYRRKPIHGSYLSDEDFDYFYANPGSLPRRSHHFPVMIQSARALRLPSGTELENAEDPHADGDQPELVITVRPPSEVRFSTIRSGIAGSKIVVPLDDLQSPVVEAPSPEEQKEVHDPALPPSPIRQDLQMSRDNCAKVNAYALMFGVKNPQSWVRKNCPFVRTFVQASCKDINTFVDSCYRFH